MLSHRDNHVVDRESFVEVDSPDGDGPVLQVQPAPRLSRTPGAVRHAGLAAGASTEEVLAELGYGPGEVEELRAAGAIGQARQPAAAS